MNKIMRVKVEGESESSTRINLRSGSKQMIIDEPFQMGGTDMGPTPVQALLFALAGCLNVTGNFVAKEMGLPLEKMKITIEGSLNPCKFMGMSDEERAGFISIDVIIKPSFSMNVEKEKIKEWINETERRCPVTDNIQTSTHINIKV